MTATARIAIRITGPRLLRGRYWSSETVGWVGAPSGALPGIGRLGILRGAAGGCRGLVSGWPPQAGAGLPHAGFGWPQFGVGPCWDELGQIPLAGCCGVLMIP